MSRLFAKIQEQVEDKDTLVFVLIDEVESLTSARQSAVAGNEPADAIRHGLAIMRRVTWRSTQRQTTCLADCNSCTFYCAAGMVA